ncbi:MAG: type-F conjugative transfer system protein TraW [Legionellaceae bacterium]|nr:type-F conjugative transfer system protein TraW [Legionellaceae bacterium]
MRTCYLKNGSQTVQRCVLAISLLGLSFTAQASSLGVIGETFPVAERSFLSLIESRLKQFEEEGTLGEIEARWVSQVNEHAHRPTSLNLPRATQARTHRYYPSTTLGQDIRDHQGRVLMRAGTQVNALSHMPQYQPHWIFLNADDKDQIQWAQHTLRKNTKVILTAGDIGDAERALNTEIFFDQGGRITQKLHVTHVPAEVTREGATLRIDEINLKAGGYAY